METIKTDNPKLQNRKLTRLLGYLLNQIFVQKRWLLLPVWIILATAVLVMLLSGSAYLIPAIYIAF